MKIDETKYFYMLGSHIIIVTKADKDKALKIANIHLIEKRDGLKEWLVENFTNLAGS